MSEEQLRAFLARLATDNTLKQRLQANGADVVAIAREAGFVISESDLNQGQVRPWLALSDQELETTAGGMQRGSETKSGRCPCYGQGHRMTIPESAGTLDPCMVKCD